MRNVNLITMNFCLFINIFLASTSNVTLKQFKMHANTKQVQVSGKKHRQVNATLGQSASQDNITQVAGTLQLQWVEPRC